MRVQTWENKEVSVGFQEKAVIEEYRKAKVVWAYHTRARHQGSESRLNKGVRQGR